MSDSTFLCLRSASELRTLSGDYGGWFRRRDIGEVETRRSLVRSKVVIAPTVLNSAEDTSIVDEQGLLGVSTCIIIRLFLVVPLDCLPLEA